MPRHRHPIHPLGTYFLHGDGRPRQVRILEVGRRGRQEGKVHVEDTSRGRTRFWIAAEHLSRSAKPPRRRRPMTDTLAALGLAAPRTRA